MKGNRISLTTNHGAHHSHSANLQPRPATESVEIKDWNPREDEENDTYATGCKVACMGVFNASSFKERGLDCK